MLIASWNVNSIKQRMDRILEFVELHDPDVLCLQETKCTTEQFPQLELQAAGYSGVECSAGRWGGVAILARSEPTDVVRGLPGEPDPDQARWIEATVEGVRIISIYAVNGRTLQDPEYQRKLAFYDAVRDRVAEVAGGGPLVITGDFNIAPRDADVWDPQAVHGGTHVSQAERDRLAAVMAAGDLSDAFLVAPETGPERFTWWDYRAGAFHRDLGMRIDLALVSPDVAAALEWVGIARDFRKGSKPSDHAPLLVRSSM